MIRNASGVALLMLLAGCSSLLPPGPPPPHRHDFGPPTTGWQMARPAMPPGIVISAIQTPEWLDNANIHYRSVPTDPTGVNAYARNVWVDSPAHLMRACLERHGINGRQHRESRFALSLSISDFEQIITAPDQAHVDVRITASLRDLSNGQLVASHHFLDHHPVTPDVKGAVRGLAKAGSDQCRNILDWIGKTLGR